MGVTRRVLDAGDFRRVLDLSHEVWRHEPGRLNFETSFGTLAWTSGAAGRTCLFERNGELVGWARLSPGYQRIRRMGVRDDAPPSLTWLLDWSDPSPEEILATMVDWAESEADTPFTTSYAVGDDVSALVLGTRGYRPDPTEPFGIYTQQPLPAERGERPEGYRLTTMADLGDPEVRAEAHRVAWEGSTRSSDDVKATMRQWPYRADLDIVALTDGGEPVGSALVWYDVAYEYGEFEPVGTAPGHRGRGLAKAMLRLGFERLAAAGASHAVVGARGDDDYPIPRRLYSAVGFQVFTTQTIVRRT